MAWGKQEILSLVLFTYQVDSWRCLPIHHHTHRYFHYPNLEQLKKKIPEENALKFWELLGVVFITITGIWSLYAEC